MIIDSSAVIAILRAEADSRIYAEAMKPARDRRMSAASFVETGIVVDSSKDPGSSRRFDELVQFANIVIEPVTPEQARIAREAYRDFGKGSGHAAQLNFGDCFAYALAKDKGEPLLFKGRDFSHTDVMPALK